MPQKIKITHLGGCGISPIFRKYLDSIHGEFSSQVLEAKGNDVFDLYSSYGCRVYDKTFGVFHHKYKMMFDAMLTNAHIYHVHSTYKLKKMISRLKKRMIMQYWGTDVRKSSPKQREEVENYSSMILVGTPDLLDYDYAVKPVYLPIPVDTEIFCKSEFPANNKALIHLKYNQTKEETLEFLKTNGYGDLDITWVTQPERNGSKKVPYLRVPDLLQGYEYLIDLYIQTGTAEPVGANSTLGLQAMAMGMKVISHDMRVHSSLPNPHRPENVVGTLKNYYKKILED